jgi:hypothetical protein
MDINAEITYYLLRDIGIHIPKHSVVDGGNMNAPTFVCDRLHIEEFNNYFSVAQYETMNEHNLFNSCN